MTSGARISPSNDQITPSEVVGFWLGAGPRKWFAKNAAFDAEIRRRFEPLHMAASRGELMDWAGTAEGALALLILLDQFPRNLYRNSGRAFTTDPLARNVAVEALSRGFDQAVEPSLRPFFYLPFTHSERIEDQDRSVALCQAHFETAGDKSTLDWAIRHRDIIARFGRFPHRNRGLGRSTTPEEQAFLDQGGFSG
jgi:uncharacterized protein (DUF924 family)